MRRVTRRVLLARDGYRCQYCGWQAPPGRARALTVDHVKPQHLYPSRQAATTWDNVVAACFDCNQAKGGLLPMHAGMWPGMYHGVPYVPAVPSLVQLRFAGRCNAAQRDYIRDFYALDGQDAHAL